MRRLRAVVLALLVVAGSLGPVAGADDWNQPGGDAARSGYVATQGPLFGDFVLRVTPNWTGREGEVRAAPIMVGGHVYGATLGFALDLTNPDDVRRESRYLHEVVRVDPDTGTDRALPSFFSNAYRPVLAESDGRLLVLTGPILRALNTSSNSWDWEVLLGIESAELPKGDYDEAAFAIDCGEMAVRKSVIVVACVHHPPSFDVPFLAAVNPRTGGRLWTVVYGSALDEGLAPGLATPSGNPLLFVGGLAVEGNTAAVLLHRDGHPGSLGDRYAGGASGYVSWIVDLEKRSTNWTRVSTESFKFMSMVATGSTTTAKGNFPSWPMLRDGYAYFEHDSIARFPTNRFADPTQRDIRRGEPFEGDSRTGMAWGPRGLYVPSLHGIVLLRPDLTVVARHWLDPGETVVANSQAIVSDACVFLSTTAALRCLDPATLRERWAFDEAGGALFAVSGGILAAHLPSRDIVLLGASDASPRFTPRPSSLYPGVGKSFSLDLRQSTPGLQGPLTEFAVNWGDGHSLDWQPSPIMEHRYSAPGDYEVRFMGRNEYRQSTTQTLTVHVGGTDPNLTAFQAALLPENQERTFFVVGLIVTLLLAAGGILRSRIRHARLQRELAGVEAAFARNQEKPEACIAVLDDRRGHARDLLRRRRLDESQVGTLERRIDELRRLVRMRLLDQRFQYLPVGLAKRLYAALEDGAVTELERAHFVDGIRADPILTGRQKSALIALIDEWRQADERRWKASPTSSPSSSRS